MTQGEVKPKIEEEIEIIAKEHILETPRQKIVEIEKGKGMKIKSITPAEFGEIWAAAKRDEILTTFLMIHKAVVEPELTLEEVKRLKFPILRKLSTEIGQFSGLAVPEIGREVPFHS